MGVPGRTDQPVCAGNAERPGRMQGQWESSRARSPSSPARPAARAAATRSGSPQEGADIIAVDICQQIDAVSYPMSTPRTSRRPRSQVEALGPADRRRAGRRPRLGRVAAGVRRRASAEFGPVDIVLANAGIGPVGLGAGGPGVAGRHRR